MARTLAAVALLCGAAASAADFDHTYAGYAAVLQRHVKWVDQGHASRVDYAGLQGERAALQSELRAFSAVPATAFAAWTSAQKKAFLLNAYNAYTLELVLTKYPDVDSIRDLGSLLRSPWKKRFFRLLGEERSLDWIEHEQLRPVFRDARVHFAANCASMGCPALRDEPYRADRLDTQLDDQQRRFLGDRSRNRFNAAAGTLQVSSLFKWYGDDFSKSGDGDANAWLSKQAPQLSDDVAEQARIATGAFELTFLPYDWSLNDAARGR